MPPEYGYGEMSVGDKFPPKALLVFYVELLKITDPNEESGKPNMFREIDVDGDGMISHREVKQVNDWEKRRKELYIKKSEQTDTM